MVFRLFLTALLCIVLADLLHKNAYRKDHITWDTYKASRKFVFFDALRISKFVLPVVLLSFVIKGAL